MTAEPTLEAVQTVIAQVAGAHRTPPDAGPDTPLADGGFWLDSVHVLEAVMACEAAFGVVFDPERDFTDESLSTVRSLCALILARRHG